MERTTAGLRPQPPNFQSIVAFNRGPLALSVVEAHPLTPRQVQQLDAPVIDVRTSLQFDEAHIPGAIANTILQAGFGTRLAWVAGPETAVVLVGRDDADALRAAELAAAVGVVRIAGYLAGGMTSWREERLPVESIQRVTVDELHGLATCRSSTCASATSGSASTSRARCSRPYHDIDRLPDGLDPSRRSRSSARPASARPSARRSSSGSARARSCTSSTAASARGVARATRLVR